MSGHPTGRFVIAVDGPSGVGKTTVSTQVAAALGCDQLDTGAFYRAAAFLALIARANLSNEAEVMSSVAAVDLDYRNGAMLAEGVDLGQTIRSELVSAAASRLAALPGLRMLLVRRQRAWVAARNGSAVVEGRDIGTVVFPAADLKVFLTARPEVRAARRAGQTATRVDEVRANLARRDHRDETRAASPLIPAVDAVTVDTSDIAVEEVIGRILHLCVERGIGPRRAL